MSGWLIWIEKWHDIEALDSVFGVASYIKGGGKKEISLNPS